jgi:hypothetical protein
MTLLISISQTNGLAVLVPTLGQPDHPISHRDFFLCGYIKDCVCQTPVANINDLKTGIQVAIATVDVDMLQCTWMELEYHLDIIRVTNGAHAECK